MTDALQRLLDTLTVFLAENPLVGAWYTTVVRFVFPLLALMILVGAIRSLWKVKHPDEVWGYLGMANGVRLPITHWENIIGRAPACDVQLEYPSVSRQHAALIREDDGSWTVYDLGSKGGVKVNDLPVDEYAVVEDGDTLSFGGIPTMLVPISAEEKREQMAERRVEGRPAGMWGSLVLLTLFQVLTALQLIVAAGENASVTVPLTFLTFTAVCWGYFIVLRSFRRIGFEMETIAFFLCTLSLAVTGSTVPDECPKQLVAILMGLAIFLVLGFFLRDLTRAQRVRWIMGAAAVGMLVITLLIGSSEGGAKAWIRLGGLSLQPSELAKICYIFAGAATLDRLFNKRNLWLFIGLTGICGACLALQNDFGTALVFFVTFLVIAYLRSGDFATLGLICAGCFAGGMVLLTVKGHVAARFASWGHIWEDVYGAGFQQTHTLTAAASGGMIGVGAGKGWLSGLAAADTDIVFGMLCEEWGLVIAVLTVLCIITLAVFAVRACRAGRSSFYTIAACAATSLLVFQTCLNVFGAVDILPFTGVTLPFVSNGGSSMLSAWGMLAFLKATDTRQNASFAVRLPSRRELRGEVD
ncbi:FtsW/RodA/SpoVE family cell cycle protein [Agathobaculum sp. NSJ-28]|uniref:FtsW/RodA/SpoVE family cell cycle protein n=2 Tax=Agathobaculum TaxID=2048137 RepID=A0A923LUE6_9FIRM|nr:MULTISPECIES: FtsW/RodA/SpoVE family cell cycle protein [Butyricicoccaceae]MBS6881738.1 FtsW/RodA/SpoVE family cell cycle protein [Clostridiaceae bacterium]SCI58916.1 Cell division protein FtsW [uncultured Butyricicoccus sp.]MBC5724345.1 FtsW/RodA/SpoVE family cell cycle protein [Agathobaculum faecis]MCU6788083.1 FtsW/RodA/SpoVE family cell cycle protein [Agathobaculum ammoniilyticum]WOC75363.1 FtsW/RodA/SpoVE family cell cycle protein [Intestinibacillus sp. NTUH-41-i26]